MGQPQQGGRAYLGGVGTGEDFELTHSSIYLTRELLEYLKGIIPQTQN